MFKQSFSSKFGYLKAPTTFLVGSVTALTGLAIWVKTKNDQPAKWYRLTHRNEELTPLTDTPSFRYSVCSIQGKRDHMEDRSCRFQLATPSLISVFGVFDGHGGHISSTFVAKNFPSAFSSIVSNESKDSLSNNLGELLSTSLSKTHDMLLQSNPTKSPRDGTTAVVCALNDGKLWTANIGDSRAVLSRSRRAIDLSKDHKPDDPIEKNRIEALGGFVKTSNGDCPRVYRKDGYGGLAMSRAMGDEFYKETGSVYVPCEADITVHQMYKEDEFIILASDGLWDVMTSEEATDYIHLLKHINKYVTVTYLAQALVYAASEKKSTDNITVAIILFDTPEEKTVEEPSSDTPKADKTSSVEAPKKE